MSTAPPCLRRGRFTDVTFRRSCHIQSTLTSSGWPTRARARCKVPGESQKSTSFPACSDLSIVEGPVPAQKGQTGSSLATQSSVEPGQNQEHAKDNRKPGGMSRAQLIQFKCTCALVYCERKCQNAHVSVEQAPTERKPMAPPRFHICHRDELGESHIAIHSGT